MTQKMTYANLSNRVAEEAQLLAEEKWIIEALEKVKTQRNCLQIERLQLESMKKQLEIPLSKPTSTKSHDPDHNKVPLKDNLDTSQIPNATDADSAQTVLLETEALCNKEQLNLNVSNSVFSQLPVDMNAEEDEEEYDEEDGEDLLIDMNMFMHGSQIKKSKES